MLTSSPRKSCSVSPKLIKAARAELARRQAQKLTASDLVWTPLPGPQTIAAESPATILGYGGAAGGGKTDLLIGLALTRHRRSIIFRREFVQLKGIVDRVKAILEKAADPGRFNANEMIFRFRDGRSLELGAVKDADDWTKYKGRPHDFIGFDEATEFLEIQVASLLAWLRTTDPDQRCRAVLGFNPPTDPAGEWIRKWFAPWVDREDAHPAGPGEVVWYAASADGIVRVDPPGGLKPAAALGMDSGSDQSIPISRTFVPARLGDNPFQDTAEYRSVLQSLPEPLRSQLLRGDFDAAAAPDPWQVIPALWVRLAQNRWLSRKPDVGLTCVGVDVAHGGSDQTVIAKRYGNYFSRLHKHPGRSTPSGSSAAAVVVKALAVDEVNSPLHVDVIGYGASCHERLAEPPPEGHGLNAKPVNFAAKSHYRDKSGKYKAINLRAEAYWRLREALDPESGDDLALPPDPELLSDLCAPHYKITPSGIQIEDKPSIKARIGRSIDCGDAVALTMLMPREIRIIDIKV